MRIFSKCWSGSRCRADSDDAILGNGHSSPLTAKDARGRSITSAPSVLLGLACSSACSSLQAASCDQWPQRTACALEQVEKALRCSARLLVVSTEGLPWVFSSSDEASTPTDDERMALKHLADVLSQQAEGTSVVLRRCRDARNGIHQVLAWRQGTPIVLEPLDLLALPLQLPSSPAAAALLVGWESAPDPLLELCTTPTGANNTCVPSPDLAELHRLAQFLGYGLLGDPSHARYVARVCRHLSLLTAAPSLHGLVSTLVEALQDLLLARFALQMHVVLVAAHGPNNPAVLFSVRPGPTGQLQPCMSDAQVHINSLLAPPMSVSRGPLSQPLVGLAHGAAGGGEAGGARIGTSLAPSGHGTVPEGSRVRALRTSLAHTLLLQAIRSAPDLANLMAPLPSQGKSRDAGAPASHSYSTCDDSRKPASFADSGARCRAAAALPAKAGLQSVVIPNASSHMFEDKQPCRDLLLCNRLAGGKSGSAMLLVESGIRSDASTTASTTALLSSHMPVADVLRGVGKASRGTCPVGTAHGSSGEDVTSGVSSRSYDAGRSARGGTPGVLPVHTSATHRHAPYQLGVYLLSTEVLPAGLLRLVMEELQALLPMFFNTFHACLACAEPKASCAVSDWRRLQELLLGPLAHPGTDLTMGAEPSTPPAGLPSAPPHLQPQGSGHPDRCLHPAMVLEASVDSPVSPVQPGRSQGPSQRLFKPAVPPSMLSAAAPPLPAQRSTPAPGSHSGGAAGVALPGSHAGKGALKGLVMSQGGGVIRKGVLAMLASRDEAGLSQLHDISTPGSAVGTCGDVSSPRGGKAARQVDSPQIYSMSDGRTGSSAMLEARLVPGLMHLGSVPQVTLERVGGPSALDVLVNSMRQGLSAAGPEERDDRASQAQDLAAVQLLEVLGRGGQGVVFRGTLHGLETAIKVLTDSGSSPGLDEEASAPGGSQVPGQAQPGPGLNANGEGGAGTAPGGGAAAGTSDTWGADGKVGEARIRQAKRGAMEVAVIGTLSHPSIVQVYATFSGVVVVRCQYHDSPRAEMRLCFPTDEMLAGKDPGPLNQVICLEYCDQGTLMGAARAGAFRQPLSVAANAPAFPALVPLYKSLLEVALALRYLHSRKLVHCDLKAANVLLKSSTRDPRGWTCKLSDFGCARLLTESGPEGGPAVGFRTAAPVGTLSHMAPECFIKNSLLTPAVDVYSFGVLMWELLMCRSPYVGMNAKDVPRQVIRHSLRPSFHSLAPAEYCALASRCWVPKVERRPTAIDLVGLLEQLLADAHTAATSTGNSTGTSPATTPATSTAKSPATSPGDHAGV